MPPRARSLPAPLERFVLRHNLLGGPNGPGYEDEWVRFTARGRSPLRIRVGLSLGVYSSPRHGNIVRSIWLEKYLHCASGDVLGTGCKPSQQHR